MDISGHVMVGRPYSRCLLAFLFILYRPFTFFPTLLEFSQKPIRFAAGIIQNERFKGVPGAQ